MATKTQQEEKRGATPAAPVEHPAPPREVRVVRHAPRRPRTHWLGWLVSFMLVAAAVGALVVVLQEDDVAPLPVEYDGYVAFDEATVTPRIGAGYAPSGWLHERAPAGSYDGLAIHSGALAPVVGEGYVPSGWLAYRAPAGSYDGMVVFDPVAITPRIGPGYVPSGWITDVTTLEALVAEGALPTAALDSFYRTTAPTTLEALVAEGVLPTAALDPAYRAATVAELVDMGLLPTAALDPVYSDR